MADFKTFIKGLGSTLGDLGVPFVSSVANMAVGLLGSKLQKNVVNNHMSGAEREAFDLNAQEAQKARDWNLQMDNTKYQRQVADMQSAGINPALAMNGGVSTQATSNVTANASTQQAPMMSVVDLATTAANLKNLQAQKNLTDAQARLANANAEGVETENKYRDQFEQLKLKGQENANNLTQTQIDKLNKDIEKAGEEIKLIIAQAETEKERKNAVAAQAMLDKANAQQIEVLRPFLIKLYEAQTQEAKSRAAYNFAMAAYQQNLIDEGYVKALAAKEGFNAQQAEQFALQISGENAKRGLTDTMSNGEEFYDGKFAKFCGTTLYQIADLLGSVLGIGVNFQGNTHTSKSQSTSTSTNTNTNTSHSESVNWNMR